MRIAVVSDAVAPWHVGGKEARYREIAKRWERAGEDVQIYTMKWWDGQRPAGHHGLMPKMDLYKRDGQRSVLQALVFSIACLRMLFVRADVIEADHMPGPQLIVLALVARLRRIPIVATWHEYWGTAAWIEYSGRLGIIGAWVERTGARMVTAIVAVSAQTFNRLIEAGVVAEKVHLVENGTIGETSGWPEVRDGIVVFGRVVPHKRVDVAIRVVAELETQGRVHHLTVIGDGPELENMRRLAMELGVGKYIEFTGALEEQGEVWERVRKAETCLMPSEREGYGIAVAEALALGTPVVVSDATENASRNLIEDGRTGRICQAGDVKAFAEAVLETVGYDNFDVQERFLTDHGGTGWDEVAEKQRALYKSLILWGQR